MTLHVFEDVGVSMVVILLGGLRLAMHYRVVQIAIPHHFVGQVSSDLAASSPGLEFDDDAQVLLSFKEG